MLKPWNHCKILFILMINVLYSVPVEFQKYRKKPVQTAQHNILTAHELFKHGFPELFFV